jgi:hypothetical protein
MPAVQRLILHGRSWQAGYEDACRVLERKPWEIEIDPIVGVAVHDAVTR